MYSFSKRRTTIMVRSDAETLDHYGLTMILFVVVLIIIIVMNVDEV